MKHPYKELGDFADTNKRSALMNNVFVAFFGLLLIAVIFGLALMDRFYAVRVSGGSMESTLYDGDVLFADRYARAERGDIVILDVTPYKERGVFRGEFIIKRVIATAGDRIKCEEDGVYLMRAGEGKFTKLDEPYLTFETSPFSEVTVGEGEIFFMGDHRTNSVDSRAEGVGCLKVRDIVGVVPKWAVEHKAQIAAFRNLFGGGTKTEE